MQRGSLFTYVPGPTGQQGCLWSHALSISTAIFLKDPPSFLAFVLGQITIPGNTSLFGHSLHRSSGAPYAWAREAPGGILGSLGSPRGYASGCVRMSNIYHMLTRRKLPGVRVYNKVCTRWSLGGLVAGSARSGPLFSRAAHSHVQIRITYNSYATVFNYLPDIIT